MARSLMLQEKALLGLVLSVSVLFPLAPWPLTAKMWAIAYGICPQRTSHSYFLAGQQMPIEARMTGIFAGFLLALGYFFFIGRGKASRLPPPWVLGVLIGLVAVMGIDGLNATLFDFGWPYAYPPQNSLRLATGFLGGVAIAAITWPVLSFTFWRNPFPAPPLANGRELLSSLLLPFLFFVAIINQYAPSFYPISLVSVLGVLAFLSVLNTVFLIPISHRQGRGEFWSDLLFPASGGLVLSGLELVVLSALKFAVLGAAPPP